MELGWIAEQFLFVLLFVGLLAAQMAFVIRLNNSTKRTKLVIPFFARVGLLLEAVFLAGSIILVLLSHP